jgi:hypothetical protein
MCKYESLKDGSLDLADIARMNDAIQVKAINARIANGEDKWQTRRSKAS